MSVAVVAISAVTVAATGCCDVSRILSTVLIGVVFLPVIAGGSRIHRALCVNGRLWRSDISRRWSRVVVHGNLGRLARRDCIAVVSRRSRVCVPWRRGIVVARWMVRARPVVIPAVIVNVN